MPKCICPKRQLKRCAQALTQAFHYFANAKMHLPKKAIKAVRGGALTAARTQA